MADNDKKRYYWLKLEKDFFKRHDIRIIECMPNGKDYIIFYLKLLCESTSHEGYLRFSETIPYNENMLSTITNTNIDIVRSAIKVFTELQMMTIYDDGTIYFKQVEKMIGSETGGAERKRLYRETQKNLIGTNVGQCPLDIEKDIELDKEIDIDKEKNILKKENDGIITLQKFLEEIEMMMGRTITGKNCDLACKMFEDYGYEKSINAIKDNMDKVSPVGYAYKVLESGTIQEKVYEEQPKVKTYEFNDWLSAWKVYTDKEAPEDIRKKAKDYMDGK